MRSRLRCECDRWQTRRSCTKDRDRWMDKANSFQKDDLVHRVNLSPEAARHSHPLLVSPDPDPGGLKALCLSSLSLFPSLSAPRPSLQPSLECPPHSPHGVGRAGRMRHFRRLTLKVTAPRSIGAKSLPHPRGQCPTFKSTPMLRDSKETRFYSAAEASASLRTLASQ